MTVHRDELSPIFILGAPRSGTSLLYKALCLHPESAWISNYLHRFPALGPVSVLNRVARSLPSMQRDVWFGADSNAYVYGQRRSVRERLFPMPAEGEPVFERCGLPQDPSAVSLAAEDRNGRVQRSFHDLRMYGGGDVVVSKRIGHNRRIKLLLSAFPNARFVHLVRDGRAVAYSLANVDWWHELVIWWYGGTPEAWMRSGRDPWELCAQHWVEELRVVTEGLATVPPEQQLRLFYEDLVKSPIEVLGQVAGFSGLGPSSAWNGTLDGLRFPNQNERWVELLDPAAQQKILAVQEPLLRSCGYVV